MKNNYSYNRKAKNRPATLKIMRLVIILLACAGFKNNARAQVPSAPVATSASNFTCTAIDANWGAVSGATAYFLDVSTNSTFNSGNFVSGYNNLNVSNVLTYSVTGLTVNTTYYYRVRAYNGSNTSSNSNTITSSTAYPVLTSTLSPIAICSGTVFTYTPTSSTPGASLSWTRAVIAGISNSANSGTGNPNETLNNTTSSPINVIYVFTVTANSCTNPTSYNVIVAVNPAPTLNSSLTPPAICSGTVFNYTPTSSTSGAAFAWTRALVAGISNSVGNGTADPYETLINTTVSPNNVTYVYTASINGCGNNQSVVVTVNPLPTLSSTLSPPAICDGTVFNYVPTSLTVGATFSWTRAVVTGVSNAAASGTGAPNETLINTTTSSVNTIYIFTVTANGCANTTTFSIVAAINPIPTAHAGPDKTVCFGDTAILSGTGGVSYLWSDGTHSFTAPVIQVSPLTATSYTLTITDNSGCTASDIAVVLVTLSKDIYGHVAYSGGNLTNGKVVIYKYVQFQPRFDTIQVASVNSSGNYHFSSINHGNYLIKVFVDTAIYHTLVPTYYGNAFLWNDPAVVVFNHNCAVNDTLNNITMIEAAGIGGGIGLLIGQIIEGAGYGRLIGEPIPGVDIKLGKNPGGSLMATATTDVTGHYTFAGVPLGNYTIYADIPGLGRDSSFTFTIDSTNNQFVHMDYKADSTGVHINPFSSLGIGNPEITKEIKLMLYPNPFKGNATIEYNIRQITGAKIILDVYNVLGVKVKSLVNATQPAGNYKYNLNTQNNNLNCGVYFISLAIDGKTITKRIIVME